MLKNLGEKKIEQIKVGGGIIEKKKKKRPEMNRYYSKQNRKLLRAAPAATARSMKNKLQVQKLIDEQAPRLTIYETEFVEEAEL